ncbi:hypothetical protein KKC65_01690 [Patescibacteria group bacterium]|nr:hypothetical protein [Patescibacteria group bacterium]
MIEKNRNFDKILNQTLKYAKNIAKEFYFQEWGENPPKCPAFDGEVVNITREGWEHITHDEIKTKTDILGRLFVLERAKVLLETATVYTTRERETGRKKKYWIFEGVISDVRIKVVVRSIDDNPKHFLTVIKKGSVEKDIKKMVNKNSAVSRL